MGGATKRTVATVVLMVCAPFLCLGATVFAAAQPEPVEPKVVQPRKDYAEEYHPALKDNAKQIPELLSYGPDAPACVRFEPAGLHITLPLGYPKPRPGTGVVTDFGVKGDFEITIAFEILPGKTPDLPVNWANLRIVIVPNEPPVPEVWHKADQNRAVLAREITGKESAGTFLGNATKWNSDVPRDKWNNEDFSKVEQHDGKRSPAVALTGRLRLVRIGADLFFFTSENADPEFKQLRPKYEFGIKDLKNVHFLASTGTAGDTVDVLVTDLHIRADGFVKGAVVPPPPAAQPVAQPRSLVVPIIIALSILGVIVLSLPLGILLFLRKRPGDATSKATPSRAGTLVFACPHCGKRIKAKAGLAGKTIKCPKCGNAVKAPSTSAEDAEEVS
jgi:predicted RNA-binding Zn-ribbon protein involved in translation (DUF1610 family)